MNPQNTLYPIFVKPEVIPILIIGGGECAQEKVTNILKSSPNAQLTIVGKKISNEIKERTVTFANILLLEESYHVSHLDKFSLVIIATNDKKLNEIIKSDCEKRGILANVVDTPNLCDFYLGSVITKGHLKIAVSTNGMAPTLAKRIREFLEEILPDDLSNLAENLNLIRIKYKDDFAAKVKKLNDYTKDLMFRTTE